MATKLFKGIDGRKIDCACGHENCLTGLSFDIQGYYGILRMHYPNIERDENKKIIKIEQNETPIRIEVKQIDEIIENLKEIKYELKKQINREISPHIIYNWRKGRTYLRKSDREMINKFFQEKIF